MFFKTDFLKLDKELMIKKNNFLYIDLKYKIKFVTTKNNITSK